MFRKTFLDHPAEVGETYSQHFAVAASFGMTMIIGGFGALLHAIMPSLCKTTGSRTVLKLHQRLVKSRGDVRDARTIEWMI
jgi:Family of unknown function (DUF6356)